MRIPINIVFSQCLIGVGVQRWAALLEARVVARGELGYEFVEGSGESFELTVGHLVEVADGYEGLDVGGVSL